MSLDQWARWLLERRHGGDEDRLKQVMESLAPVREKVLENAALAGDETLLDVGSGDGLIAFGALDKLPDGQVIFSDISQNLLDHTRELAEQMGVLDRCRFVQADAADLASIEDESVNVVTTRSVLIYVREKLRAFQAFYRVLKPDAVLSIFEPINRFAYPEPYHMLWGYNAAPILELAQKVKAVYRAIQPPDSDPMLNFDERDLIRLIETAGFREIHLELRAEVTPTSVWRGMDWESMIDTAPNPRVPTLREAMQQALLPDEVTQFAEYMREQVENGRGTYRMAVAYIWAVK